MTDFRITATDSQGGHSTITVASDSIIEATAQGLETLDREAPDRAFTISAIDEQGGSSARSGNHEQPSELVFCIERDPETGQLAIHSDIVPSGLSLEGFHLGGVAALIGDGETRTGDADIRSRIRVGARVAFPSEALSQHSEPPRGMMMVRLQAGGQLPVDLKASEIGEGLRAVAHGSESPTLGNVLSNAEEFVVVDLAPSAQNTPHCIADLISQFLESDDAEAIQGGFYRHLSRVYHHQAKENVPAVHDEIYVDFKSGVGFVRDELGDCAFFFSPVSG